MCGIFGCYFKFEIIVRFFKKYRFWIQFIIGFFFKIYFFNYGDNLNFYKFWKINQVFVIIKENSEEVDGNLLFEMLIKFILGELFSFYRDCWLIQ